MPLRAASDQYNVPRSAIFIRTKRKVSLKATMGPSTYLSKKEEARLCEWIIYLGAGRFSVTKTQLLHSVPSLVTELGREAPL